MRSHRGIGKIAAGRAANRRVPAALAATVAVTATLAVTAACGEPVADSEFGPSSTLSPIGLDPTPTGRVQGEAPRPARRLAAPELIDNTLLIGTSTSAQPASARSVAAFDASSGKTRWVLTEHADLGGGVAWEYGGDPPLATSQPGGSMVLISYQKRRTAGATERGIALLAGRDRRVLGTIPEPGDVGRLNLRAIHGSIVIAEFSRPGAGPAANGAAANGRTVTAAYDVVARKKLWEAPDVHLRSFAGETLVGVRTSAGYAEDPTGANTGSSNTGLSNAVPDDAVVVALNARTGAKRWESTRYRSPLVAQVSTDTAVVRTAGRVVVVDAATGRELGSRNSALGLCQGDGTLIACVPDPNLHGLGFSPTVLVINRVGARAEITPVAVPGGGQTAVIDRVVNGRIFIKTTKGAMSMDRHGRVVNPRLPGALAAINGAYAVFRTGPEKDLTSTFLTYRLIP